MTAAPVASGAKISRTPTSGSQNSEQRSHGIERYLRCQPPPNHLPSEADIRPPFRVLSVPSLDNDRSLPNTCETVIERKTVKVGPLPGCRQLKAVVDREEKQSGASLSACERLVDAPKGGLTRLIEGERGPSLALAVRMRDVWGIPVEAWIEGYKKPKP